MVKPYGYTMRVFTHIHYDCIDTNYITCETLGSYTQLTQIGNIKK
jgi:hypothetical protein